LIVVDASVAVKWFVPEDGDESARALLAAHDGAFFAPAHAIAEVGGALARSHRLGAISSEHARRALEYLRGHVRFVPTEDLASPALDITLAHGISIYDALYVAAADRHDAPLVTADIRLIRALAASPFAERVRALGWSEDGPSA
jgi:predicted nucleic acid-binding protein